MSSYKYSVSGGNSLRARVYLGVDGKASDIRDVSERCQEPEV